MSSASRACLVVAAIAAAMAMTASATTYEQKDRATLRALDKITGRATDIEVKVGEPVVYGSLEVDLQSCFQAPPEEPPESAAFLRIRSTQPVAVETMEAAVSADTVSTVDPENPVLFSGWMFASSPGLSALEHPVYDVWVIRCTAPAPVRGPERRLVVDAGGPFIDDIPVAIDESESPLAPPDIGAAEDPAE